MAHSLEFNQDTQTHSFVSAGNQTAWHGLGQILPDELLTAEQCIKYANLGFIVEKTPVYAYTPDRVEVADQFATFRTDNGKVLGIVGKKYSVIQNTEAFAFFDALIGEGAAIYETAGVLHEGQQIFLTAKMPDYIRIGGSDDIIENYVVLKLSHDGSSAVKAMITPIRVVCQNTLNAAIKNAVSSVSIRHTKSASERLAEAHKLLGLSNTYMSNFNQICNELAVKKLTDRDFTGLVEKLFPSTKDGGDSTRVKNIREAVTSSYFTGIGQDKIIGTAWGAYNAVTHYFGHVKNYTDADSKFEALMDGNSARTQQKAFDMLVTM